MKGKLGKVVSVALILSMILAGCGTEPSENGVKDTLTVAVQADPPTLDPHAASASTSVNALLPVYETLVRYDDNGELVPLLAESWEQVDELSWKFNLKKGVKFHNGEEMKASDVLYSFQRAAGPDGVKVSHVMGIVDAENSEIVDDHTVIIRTYEPFAPFVGYMPYIGASVISEKEFTTDSEKAAANPCGTGPFKYVDRKKNNSISYVRNDDYWGEKTAYTNLVVRTIVEANSRVIELEAGTVDIAYDIPATDVERLQNNKDTKIETNNSTTYEYLGMNTAVEPFNNPEFRRAIDLAINEEELVASVYRGTAVYTPGPVTPNMKYYDDSDTSCRYDPEEARKILSELNIAEGTTYELKTYEAKSRIDAATIIQSMLKEAGINVEIKTLETAAFWNDLEQGNSQFFISGFGAVGFPEPDNNLFGPIHSRQIPASNFCFYSNSDLDTLLDSSRTTADGPEREAIIRDIQKLLRAEVPYITYANPMQVVGLRSNVMGFRPSPAQSHFVDRVYFE